MKDFPLFRSAKAGAVGTLLIAAPLLLLSLSPLTGLYAAVAVLLLLPAASCLAGLACGAAPMMLGAAAGIYSMYRFAGQAGLLLSCAYILPILAAFVIVVSSRTPFWRGCAVMIGVHLACFSALYLLLQRLAGGNLYTAAGDAAVSALESWEAGDSMLYQLYSMGVISLKDKLARNSILPVLGGYQLSAAARKDLLLSVRTLVAEGTKALAPNLMVSHSILSGVACLLLPLRFGFILEERRAFLRGAPADGEKKPLDFPDLGMPPLSLWHLPRGIGWQVGAALAAGYFLRYGASITVQTAGIILYAASSAVFMIQGAAAVNFLQKSRGAKRVWRVIVPLALSMLSLLMFIGIFDQISNFRRLRKPREPKEDV